MKPGTLVSDLGLRTGANYADEVLVGTPGYFAQKRVQLHAAAKGALFNADGVVWDDQQIDISSVKLPASGAPSWAAYKGGQVLSFSASATNTIYFTAQLPHSYKVGSDLEFHVHLAYADGNAGDSAWTFTHSASAINGTFPTETTVALVAATSPGATDTHKVHDIADIGGTSLGISSMILCSLARVGADSGDTYGSAVLLVGADFHVQKDELGSYQEYIKDRP